MSEERETATRGPWGWVAVWVREEKFWRDIGARVLAGVFTAAIVYVGALLLGYLHTPEIGAGLLVLLGVLACASLGSGSVALLRSTRSRASRAVRVAVAVILLLAGVAIASGITVELLGP